MKGPKNWKCELYIYRSNLKILIVLHLNVLSRRKKKGTKMNSFYQIIVFPKSITIQLLDIFGNKNVKILYLMSYILTITLNFKKKKEKIGLLLKLT